MRPAVTTHDAPTYLEEGIVHYCVTNMPGAVARTSICAERCHLTFGETLADQGPEAAMGADPHLAAGLNIQRGRVKYPAVAEALAPAA